MAETVEVFLDGETSVIVTVAPEELAVANGIATTLVEASAVVGPQGPSGPTGPTGAAATDTAQTWTQRQTFQRNADDTPLVIRANSIQTADLQQWQNNAGTVVARITPFGEVNSSSRGAFGSIDGFNHASVLRVQPLVTTEVGIAVRGLASQTADLQQWQDSAGTVLASVRSDGRLTTTGSIIMDNSNRNDIVAQFFNTQPSREVLKVVAAASQTADLQQWQNNAGTVLSRIANNGDFYGALVSGTVASFLSGESKFANAAYVDPEPGVARAIKVGAGGIAVVGGIRSDGVNSSGGFTTVPQSAHWVRADTDSAQGVRGYYIGEANPRWSIGGDNYASGNSGLTFFTPGATAAAGGVKIGNIGAGTMAIATSNGTALIERVRLDSAGNAWFNTNNLHNSFIKLNAVTEATATTQNPSREVRWASNYWNGTASVEENFFAWAARQGGNPGAAGSYRFVLGTSQNPDLNYFNIAGDGSGAVGIGESFANPGLGQLFVRSLSASRFSLAVRGAASQTADLTQWQDSAGSMVARVNATGQFYGDVFARSLSFQGDLNIPVSSVVIAGSGYYTAKVSVQPRSATESGIVIRSLDSQTADLQQWQNPNGVREAFVTTLAAVPTYPTPPLMGIDMGTSRRIGFYREVANPEGGIRADSEMYFRAGGIIYFRPNAQNGGARFRVGSGFIGGSAVLESDAGGLELGEYADAGDMLYFANPVMHRQQVGRITDLYQWQNSASTIIARVMADGSISARTALIGNAGHGDDYPGFVHADSTDKGSSYALLNDLGGSTYINARAGQLIRFRSSNASKGAWSSDGLFVGRESGAGASLHVEPTTGTGQIAVLVRGLGTSHTVTNKALTANVATLTTASAHGYKVGQPVDVNGVDATFNGRYTIKSIPTTTTLTYDKVAADVVSVASGGTVTSYTQSNHLTVWDNHIGTVFGNVRADGTLDLRGGLDSGTAAQFIGASANTIGLIVTSQDSATAETVRIRAGASQSADLTQWQNSSGDTLVKIGADGAFNIGGTTGFVVGPSGPIIGGINSGFKFGPGADPLPGRRFGINNPDDLVAFTIRAFTAQTTDLQQWQDSAGAVISRIAANGQIFEGVNRVYSAGNLVPVAGLSATGTRDATTFLRGDNTWAAINISNMVTTDTVQDITASKRFLSSATTAIPLAVQRVAAQTANLQEFRDETGAILARFAPDGTLYVGTQAYGSTGSTAANTVTTDTAQTITGQKTWSTAAATTVNGIFKAIAAQTANLTEWQNDAGGIISRVASNGQIFEGANRVYSAGNPQPVPTNMATIDTTQTITGFKTFTTNAPLFSHGGTSLEVGAPATQLLLGYAGGNQYKHGIRTRHHSAQQLDNAIDFYVWTYSTAAGADIAEPTTRVLTLDTVQSVFYSPLRLLSNAATSVPDIVQAAASQSANLTEWRNSAGAVMAAIGPLGQVVDNGNRVYSAANLVPVSGLSATGTRDATTFLRGDNTWAAINISNMVTTDTAQTITGQKILSTVAVGTVNSIVRAIASQTADLMQWQNSAGALLGRVDVNGGIRDFGIVAARYVLQAGPVAAPADTNLFLSPDGATQVPARIRGAASQTADLMQFQDSAGTVLARIANDGTIYKGSTVVGGNASDTEIMAIMGGY